MLKCSRCGYIWEPRKPKPKACPECTRRTDKSHPFVKIEPAK